MLTQPDANSYAQWRLTRLAQAGTPFASRPVPAQNNINPSNAWAQITKGFARPSANPNLSEVPTQQVMKYGANGPILYGSPEANQLAFEGLRRVKAGYGLKSPQFNRALKAAMGVLGPSYDAGAIISAINY